MEPRRPPHHVLLTADAMREADRITIEDFGLPGFTLMETAGRGATDEILKAYGPAEQIRATIMCGKGNNGGDGLVVARHLVERGATVQVVLLAPADELRDDPALNLRLLETLRENSLTAQKQLTISTLSATDTSATDTSASGTRVADTLDVLTGTFRPTLYVDAMLGTGIASEVREPIRSVVEWVNDQDAPVVALDIPTGLHSDSGAILGTCIVADHTVTMAAMKAGLVIGEGASRTGATRVVDIGMPRYVLDRVAGEPGCAYRTTDADVRAWWPARGTEAHKYSVGMTLVVGGAPGYTGAPVMASQAAARSGSGYVACACPASIQPALAQMMTAIPTLALPEAQAHENRAKDASSPGLAGGIRETLANRLDKAKSLLVGPGLGRAASTRDAVCELLADVSHPLVVDADGLNAIAGTLGADDSPLSPGGRWILTPHEGEFRRLVGEPVDLTNRIAVAQEYAEAWDVVLLLKGHPSVAAAPDGRVFVGGAGGPSLATAGTGDVLAGLCAGFLAQGLDPLHAAAAGMHVGGRAAEHYAISADPRSMQAPDLLRSLPAATKTIARS